MLFVNFGLVFTIAELIKYYRWLFPRQRLRIATPYFLLPLPPVIQSIYWRLIRHLRITGFSRGYVITPPCSPTLYLIFLFICIYVFFFHFLHNDIIVKWSFILLRLIGCLNAIIFLIYTMVKICCRTFWRTLIMTAQLLQVLRIPLLFFAATTANTTQNSQTQEY